MRGIEAFSGQQTLVHPLLSGTVRMPPVTVFEHHIQTRLLALRESLLKGDSAGGSRQRIEQELVEVDGALLRLATGQYGVCQRCERALGSQRLLAEPVALLCSACAAA